MKTAIETRPQAYKRITDGIRQFINHSVGARTLIKEAKRTEIWKEKWSSWQEYCEKEFGKTARRAYQLLEIADTIDEIKSVKPFHTESEENKEILQNLNSRQAAELKGLPPEEKAEVFHKAVSVSGGRAPKPETIAKVRRSGFDADMESRSASRDEIDPVDRISKSTPGDVAVARMAIEQPEGTNSYPHIFSFEVNSYEEEKYLQVAKEKILVKRGSKNGHAKLDLHDAIAKVCNAYKAATSKTLSVKPLDAGQLRRLLQSGITLEEFIETGEKAWKSDGFLARHSHQIAMFVKHYGNIRHEISNPNRINNGKGNPRLEGVCRNDEINDYAKLAAAKCKMDSERAQAAMRQSGTAKTT